MKLRKNRKGRRRRRGKRMEKKRTFLRNIIIWKNKWWKLHFCRCSCLLILPSQVPMFSLDSLASELGHSPEEHISSSPFMCSYLFTRSEPPSKEATQCCSAAAQKGLWPGSGHPLQGWTHCSYIREQPSLHCTGCQGKTEENILNDPKENWHVTLNKQFLLWGDWKSVLPFKKKKKDSL